MNPDPNDPLLRELLSNEELEELRASTLDRGLALVRRRRAQRHAARTMRWVGSAICATALLCWLWFSLEPITDVARTVQSPRPPAMDLAVSNPTATSTDLAAARPLSDDELLGLFPGRPVALIGSPGNQKLVFLDQLQ